MTKAERQTAERFAERYRVAPAEVSRRVELAVIGGDWGANGYTTAAQADLLGHQLGSAPGVRLLDLGAGRGWPGLYLAASTGCQVVLSDVPIEGLQAAAARARQETLASHPATGSWFPRQRRRGRARGGAGEEPRRRAPTVPRILPRWPRTQRCQLPPPPSREALASGSPRRRG